jgi:hypothetical protein
MLGMGGYVAYYLTGSMGLWGMLATRLLQHTSCYLLGGFPLLSSCKQALKRAAWLDGGGQGA